jgi:hypothetical protein
MTYGQTKNDGATVYLIGAKDADYPYVKIGYSGSLRERVNSLQTANPVELTVLAIKLGTQIDEQRLHQKYLRFHTYGEWFHLNAESKPLIFGEFGLASQIHTAVEPEFLPRVQAVRVHNEKVKSSQNTKLQAAIASFREEFDNAIPTQMQEALDISFVPTHYTGMDNRCWIAASFTFLKVDIKVTRSRFHGQKLDLIRGSDNPITTSYGDLRERLLLVLGSIRNGKEEVKLKEVHTLYEESYEFPFSQPVLERDEEDEEDEELPF